MPVNYKVLSTRVGPFPKDHVFSDAEFARLHPAPEGDKDYHVSLIDRLLNDGAIAPSNERAMPTPTGPENMAPKPKAVEPKTPDPKPAEVPAKK